MPPVALPVQYSSPPGIHGSVGYTMGLPIGSVSMPGVMETGIVPGAKTQAPPSITPHAQQNSIEPSTCFKHDLLPGETILKTYDVNMPGQLISGCLFWTLTILTLGIFYIYWTCYKWCLNKGMCTLQQIHMTRGKMAITSSRRVLVWKTEFDQTTMDRGCCNCYCCFRTLFCCIRSCREKFAARVHWQSTTYSRTYTVGHINDIELRLDHQMKICCGIGCCKEKFISSVRVRFGDFKHDQASLSAAFQTIPATLYSSIISNKFSSDAYDLFALSYALVQMLAPTPEDLNWVDIVSGNIDDVKDVENPDFKSSYEGLLGIHRTLTELVAEKRAAVWNVPSDKRGLMMPHQAPVSDANAFAAQNIVGEHSCAAPDNYVPLVPGEEIIATAAEVYFVTFMDKLKLFFCALFCVIFFWVPVTPLWFVMGALFCKSLSYIVALRAKLQSRSGYILTTNRIVHVSIWRKDTIWSVCCPSFCLCCFPTQQEIIVRSLFPKSIVSGVIARKGRLLSALVLTDAGGISMNFDLTAAASMADVFNVESRITKRLAFLKAMMACAKNRSVAIDANQIKVDANCSWEELEKKVLPQIDGERLVARYTGRIHGDSCTDTCGKNGYCSHCAGCCAGDAAWHPACCLFWTCGVKPFIDNTSVLVSDSTVYAVKADENEPYGPCAPGTICHTCVKRQNWVIYWTPLTGMAGLEVSSVLTGHETLTTRCCLGTWCGNCCCPMLQGKVKLSLWCNGVTVQVTDLSKHEALRDKPQVVAFRRGVAQVQGAMMTSTFPPVHQLINRMP